MLQVHWMRPLETRMFTGRWAWRRPWLPKARSTTSVCCTIQGWDGTSLFYVPEPGPGAGQQDEEQLSGDNTDGDEEDEQQQPADSGVAKLCIYSSIAKVRLPHASLPDQPC